MRLKNLPKRPHRRTRTHEEAEKNPIINTDGFKFKDYFSSVGIDLYDGFENIDEILKDEHACMDFMTKWNDIALPKINLDCLRNNLLDAAPFKVINHKA